MFLGVTVLVLGIDLGSKYASFEFVADRPVTLVRSTELIEAYYREHGFDPETYRYVLRYDDPGNVLATQPPVVVLPGVLHLQLTTNTGAVFGLGAGNRVLLVGVSVLATAVITWLFWHSPAPAPAPGSGRVVSRRSSGSDKCVSDAVSSMSSLTTDDRRLTIGSLQHAALGLVLAGALGNLYDRVVYGAVRDMLHMLPGVRLPMGLRWPNGHDEVWPWIFNIADVSLLLGVGVLLLVGLWPRRGSK
jgi:signal peptidase II